MVPSCSPYLSSQVQGLHGSPGKGRLEGVVKRVLPDGLYEVQLVGGHSIVAHMGTSAKAQCTRVLAEDRVVVELSPFDESRGRICGRKKSW